MKKLVLLCLVVAACAAGKPWPKEYVDPSQDGNGFFCTNDEPRLAMCFRSEDNCNEQASIKSIDGCQPAASTWCREMNNNEQECFLDELQCKMEDPTNGFPARFECTQMQ